MKVISDKLIAKEEFKKFIIDNDHPCIMSQTVFQNDNLDFNEYDNFGSAETASKLLADLKKYIQTYDDSPNNFYTFIAAFPDETVTDEKLFETRLWQQLQFLHDIDDKPWDESVNSNPESDNFSFSLGGRAFYIVGLHPGSSRKARQSPYPAMVFNLHLQFERLREMDQYKNVRDKIRERDKQLQGNINPMLDDFGNSSEARQYSGREVKKNWKCPFHSSA